MKVSNIIAVVLRLFAIYWAAVGTVYGMSILAYVFPSGGMDFGLVYVLLQFATPLWYLLLAFLAWLLSFKIGNLVVLGADSEISMIKLNQHEFCQVGVVLLGLYLLLTRLATIVNWMHYWVVSRRDDADFGYDSMGVMTESQPPLYAFSDALIPLIGGLFLVWKSQAIAQKILPLEKTVEMRDQSKE